MLRYYLSNSSQPWAIELMGVAAHVYADTFAHYGFSGVSSPLNRINGRTLTFKVVKEEINNHIRTKKTNFSTKYGKEKRQESFLKQCLSDTLEDLTGALGHAGVFTYPDRPYLNWSFKYEYGEDTDKKQVRDNPATFIEGAQKLHSFLRAFRTQRPDLTDTNAAIDFGTIQKGLFEIIYFEGEKDKRCLQWQNFFQKIVKDRSLVENNNNNLPIPVYDENEWHNHRDDFDKLTVASEITSKPIYRFYQAAGFHRHYVLRELLPSYGLVVY